MPFDHSCNAQPESFAFYHIPRILVTRQEFRHPSTDAKLLYGLMLDRMGLSMRNGWYDAQGRVFIYYTMELIQEDMNCGHDKALKLLAELDAAKGVGLIERVKQGQGKPTSRHRVFPCPNLGKAAVKTSIFPRQIRIYFLAISCFMKKRAVLTF